MRVIALETERLALKPIALVDVGEIDNKEFKDVPFRLYEIFFELHTKAKNE